MWAACLSPDRSRGAGILGMELICRGNGFFFFSWIALILNVFVKGMERLVFGSFPSDFGVSD